MNEQDRQALLQIDLPEPTYTDGVPVREMFSHEQLERLRFWRWKATTEAVKEEERCDT